MKVTNREKVMLCILAIVAVFALTYYAVIKPQMDKIEKLTLKNLDLKQEVETVKAELATIGSLEAEIDMLDQELQKKTERFYPIIYQDRFIVLFDRLIKDTGIKCGGIAFSAPSLLQVKAQKAKTPQQYPLKDLADKYRAITENNNTGSVQNDSAQSTGKQTAKESKALATVSETMSVTLQIQASYNNWMTFLKNIEALNRTAVVQDLVLADDNTGILSGSILVNIYAVPKLKDSDNEYLEWPFTGKYGKTNPFAGPAGF
jgi:type IV pilus assembly protein PilO